MIGNVKEDKSMGLILFLALLLAALIAFKMVAFVATVMFIGFKICVIGLAGYIVIKCFKALFGSGR